MGVPSPSLAGDGPVGRGELHRVRQQVQHDLLDLHPVDEDRRQLLRDLADGARGDAAPGRQAAARARRGWEEAAHGLLAADGVPLVWFTDVGVNHPRFAALQMAVMAGEIAGAPDSLEAAGLSGAMRAKVGL